MLEDERKRWTSAVQIFTNAENNIAALKKKLTEEEHARCNADSALEGTQRQAED